MRSFSQQLRKTVSDNAPYRSFYMIALFALSPSQPAASSFHASEVTPIGKRARVSTAALTADSNRYAISRHETGA